MKSLIYIDNDRFELANEDADDVKNILENAGLSSEYVDSMGIIPDFYQMGKEEVLKLIFSGRSCICTYSMYSTSSYNSRGQILSILRAAAANEITDIVYIDASGMLSDMLITELREGRVKDVYNVLNAIETNYIITYKDGQLYRLRLELKGRYKSPFKIEPVDISKILCSVSGDR